MPFLVSATVQGGVVWAAEHGCWSEEAPLPDIIPQLCDHRKKNPFTPLCPAFLILERQDF